MHYWVRTLGSSALLLLAAAGCGDDESTFDTNRRLRQLRPGDDAGALLDGAVDGSAGGPMTDGGAVGIGDGAVLDGSTPMEVMNCSAVDESTWQAGVTFSDEGGFDLQAGATGFGLVYMAEVVGEERVHALPIASTGPIGEAIALFDMRPNSAKVLDTAVLRNGPDWQVAWTDNSLGRVELMLMGLDAEMAPSGGGEVTQLTDTPADEVEKRAVLARIDGSAFGAWVVEKDRRPVGVRMSPLQPFAPVDVVPAASGRWPQRVALSQVGGGTAVAGALAWVEPDEPGAQRGVWLQPLDATGVASGEPMRISDQASVGESVSIASNATGGGVAYSISVGDGSHEVRFMRLDTTGHPTSGEVEIVGGVLQGTDASIATLGLGYVIAYRALPGGSIAEPEIRLAFLTKEGIVSRNEAGNVLSLLVAKASTASAQLAVRVSNEGQLLIAWLDEVAGQKTLHLQRHRLDCF